MLRSLVFKFILLVSAVLAADVHYTFDITNAQVAPDGFNRVGCIVNNQFPATLIQANKNDVLHIANNNHLNNPTMRNSHTIHWHGLFQFRTSSEDGPAFVNQCPIAPNHSYTYDIPLNGQAGTFWYHSHLESQYIDGLKGALVIYDSDDPHKSRYDIDDANTVITLSDWYHLPTSVIEETYLHGGSGNPEPVPDSGLINGVGRYNGGPAIPWARINVQAGKRYRFRLINIAGYSHFTFGIQGHRLTIIEVDGISHQPLTVDQLNIFTAQRYSVVLNANQPVGNYWIDAPMTLQHSSENSNLDTENVHAVLHYAGASNADPSGSPPGPTGTLLQEYQLRPLDPPDVSGTPDHVFDLEFERENSGNNVWWQINGIKYEAPIIPTLNNIMFNAATQSTGWGAAEHTLFINQGDLIEVILHGSANGHVHPFHLHGHAFSVVQSQQGPRNEVNPPQRDVVGVGSGGGNVVFRFRADNPGPWFLHCHIDWHLVAGLAVVFAEDMDAMRANQIIKPEWTQLCDIYNALSEGQK
ncbi:laccase [Flagelloscypha sp. PMI_526]|nr:laccase [Flagelloscypha sp. PMI_526]